MRRPRARCRVCRRPVALTPRGVVWTHGRPECPGSRHLPYGTPDTRRIWPAKHRGRRVALVGGGIDTWTDRIEGAT